MDLNDMVFLTDISKAYGGKVLFSEASLQINEGDRLGIVGPNGAGKSTLFRLILNEESADSGKLTIDRRITIGHLPQESAAPGSETILELATAVTAEFDQIRKKLAQWETDHEAHLEEYHACQHRFEELGGYQMEPRAKTILKGLGFRDSDFDRPAREMSGGWIMRAYLARLLVWNPDLLMLDEPTNHLDLEALLWFQEYLKSFPGAILLISHDREFLNQLAGSIVEIRTGKMMRYRGNYDEFLVQRRAIVEQQEAAYKNQQREIAHLMEFVDRFRAKNTKASQAQSKLKQIEKMDLIEAPPVAPDAFEFSFPQPVRSGQKVISLSGLSHSYGDNVVYQRLDFEVQRGQRIVLVGPNGAGKSTLLKLLAGVLPVQSGERLLGHNAKAGYYSQYRLEMLNADYTVLEEAMLTPQRVTETFVRSVCGAFGFRGDDVFKPVSVLSGGEKSRLALVKLLLDPPNLLLMDEPTTHLDMEGVEALVTALAEFEGTLVFISHDVFFIRALASQVVNIRKGELTVYAGGYQYYLDRIAVQSDRHALDGVPEEKKKAATRTVDQAKEDRRLLVARQDARARERKGRKKAVDQFEQEITSLEQRREELTAELQDPATYEKNGRISEINIELSAVEARLPQLYTDWEQAARHLAQLD
jgi:ATP-binding cassette subfamily F protein 3